MKTPSVIPYNYEILSNYISTLLPKEYRHLTTNTLIIIAVTGILIFLYLDYHRNAALSEFRLLGHSGLDPESC